ncbi:Cell wall protein IFF6 [Planktothrix tepida]|uniref:DUF4347 domain-containing protein n=1 Tax=Planktothrix tepida TaxID=1678309 RepID=UPI0020B3D2F9|nr:DUF4347 domain-containing protein [Planktothrix tepida]CAD5981544.1 Cell wall protein IFF6 [Planktothrix tepida]
MNVPAINKSIIFVDSSVEDYQSLIDNADTAQIVILDNISSGIEQITNALANQQDIESVHIISHGSEGSLKLGTDVLNGNDIENFNTQLQQWGNALTENGDILLYGCNVVAGETGKNFVKRLSEITGADIAASNDLTGNQILGGDWDLEIVTGNIEATVPFNQEAMADYDYTLANFDVTAATDDGTGTVAGTLSKAILDANTAAGDDTITLTTNVRLTGTPNQLIDSNIAFIGGGFSVSGDVNNSGTNNAGDVRPFFVKSGTVSFSNLTINGGRAQGGNGPRGGGGAAGMGGALFIYNGIVTIDNVTFTSNQAIGGNSAPGALGGGGGLGGDGGSANWASGGGGGGFGGNGVSGNNVSGGAGGSGGAFGAAGAGGKGADNWDSGGNAGSFGGGGGASGDQGKPGGFGGFGGGGGAGTSTGGFGGFGGGGGYGTGVTGGFGAGNGGTIAGGGGGAGMGGAIFVREGSLTLQNTTFTNNTTTGGTGSNNNGKALAGAIFVLDAAAQTAQTTQGNTKGMPTALPTVTALGFLRTSGNAAAENASTTTDNNDIYGTIINTAPVLADTVVTLSSILEDAVAPTGAVGTLISSIAAIGTNITDPNTGAVAGVAITAADTTYGSWFYTTDGGTNWNPLGAVSNTSARLLAADANTHIYFQPTTANYNGTITNALTFRAWDQIVGTNGSTANTSINIGVSTATDTADITVTPVNDIPSFTATNPTVNEDAGAQTVTGWATFNAGSAYETAQTATYIVSNIGTPSLFAVAPAIDANGQLTYTPAADANGTSTFDVVVQDSGDTDNGGVNTSTTQTFTITVNSVNDKPSFSNAGNQILTAWTNTIQTVSNWANTVIFGPADESTQRVLNYTVTNTDNTLFTAQPTVAIDGTLTYTPSGKPGTATVSVKLQDDGGTANGGVDLSDIATFDITIPAPKVNLTVSTNTASEAGTTAITLTATAEGNVVGAQTLDLALTGTASAADFTGTIPTQITIPDGSNTGQVTITVKDDLIAEGTETATLTISNPSTGIALGTTTNQSVTITDNDTAGITVTPTTGLTTTEAGGNATFTVVLNSQPTADVTIPLTSSNTAEGTIDKTSLTFTAANWNTPQTVTITGVDDSVDDGDIAYNIVTATATSTDANYSGFDASDVAVTNTDNDIKGITVTPNTGLTTTEAGGNATFTVVLNSQPTADVTIPLTSSNTAEGTVDKTSLTFTAANWNTPQTVTITGVDDSVDDGDIAYNIVTATATSTDANYSGFDASDVAVTNTDNDIKGITVTPNTGLTTTEAGGNATFTVVLNSQPTADVTIPLTSSNTAEGTVDKTSLTFTAANWNTPQTVTITGVDDSVDDGDIAYNIVTATATSTDANYSGFDASDVAVTNTDNDIKGITVTPTTGLTTTEAGGTANFTVVLNSQPTADVTIPLTSSNTAEGTVDKTSLTFTAANWNTPQTVTITGVDDNIIDGDIAYNIVTATATSTDANYSGFDASDVAVTNTDNDIKGITVTPTTGLTTTEAGGNATFTVVLNSQPTADVTIPLTSSNTAEGTVDKTSLTFTAANWNTPQTVTITGVDDNIVDGDIAYNIVTATATSTDANYSGFDASDVAVTNTDNDIKGITVTPTTGLTTTEAGGNATFTVVLNSQPTADVTIPLTSSNTAEGTVDKTSLTFTAANWNTPQTVTITGVDDSVDDGDIAYNIVTATATSTDANYSGFDASDVAVTNTDNDIKGITVTPTTGLTTTEAGGTANFTVVLNSQPTADVTIPLTSSNTAEGTVDKTSLTFTAANWNVAQTVTITGVDDSVDDGDIAYNIVTATATSTDANYSGFDASDVAVTNTDNDIKGITVTPTTGLTTTEAGGTANFTVVLNSQPTADVTIPLTSSNTAEGTVDKTSLTFTAANWNVAQTVTITGVDDNIVDGDIAYNIVTATATSTDANYSGFDASDVAVTNTDNDIKGITVTPTTGLTTTEAGGTANFTVVLNSQPTADVTIPLTSSNTAEGTIDKTSLTFTAANWNTPQTVTITGVDDSVDDGDIAYNIVTATATSTDANYSGFDASDVAVTNTDNDIKGITVTPTTGLTTTEAGGTANFTVVLNSQPTADVTIPLTSSNTAEGTIDKTSLTFTAANWNTPQTVTITGVDDSVDDGDIAYNIVTATATSTDANYSGFDASDVAVTNTDNDIKGITVTPTTGLTTTEAGGTANFTVVLNSQPTADVTIPLTSSNTAEGTVDKTSLTFTAANWNTPQTVTITGVDDSVDDGDIAYNIVTATATSTDANYSGFDASDVAVTNTDNDIKGITVTPTTGLTTTEAGGDS